MLRTAAAGLTEEEIHQTIREVDPQLLSYISAALKETKVNQSELEIANAIFTANDLR